MKPPTKKDRSDRRPRDVTQLLVDWCQGDRTDLHSPKIGVPVYFWRPVGHSHNAFVTECFLDELAAARRERPL